VVDFAASGGLVPSGQRGKMLNQSLEHLEHLEHLHKTNDLELEKFRGQLGTVTLW
jgi:hypothetical protein